MKRVEKYIAIVLSVLLVWGLAPAGNFAYGSSYPADVPQHSLGTQVVQIPSEGENGFATHNYQGDVIALYTGTSSPTLVGTYTYDTWGKVMNVKDASGSEISPVSNPNHIMHLNPFRYRGYYYDKETGFYYLNSRY